jgi:hypothetical protein
MKAQDLGNPRVWSDQGVSEERLLPSTAVIAVHVIKGVDTDALDETDQSHNLEGVLLVLLLA